jgi:galactofuranosylgalactofuranosylrhamnosyl-N-acetylglucosaminyl-diphospho-decaprenol beta-1,5/1,6-galactofuranosyltransferase
MQTEQPTVSDQSTVSSIDDAQVLQNIEFPSIAICSVEELFFRKNDKAYYDHESRIVIFEKGGRLTFDTYFNTFSCLKWRRNTTVRQISLNIKIQGTFKVSLYQIQGSPDNRVLIYQKVITSKIIDDYVIGEDYKIPENNSLLYLDIESLSPNARLLSGFFFSNQQAVQRPKIAAIICTYKREEYVKRNLQIIREYISSNTRSDFNVYIVDNGQSLDDIIDDNIQLIPNKNFGGSGGFARGMIEVISDVNHDYSHVILLDDDILISPISLNRLSHFISFMSGNENCIAGSMFRLDKPYIQNESGAQWMQESGFSPLKQSLDMREVKNIIFNEFEEYQDYGGWWFFCIPINLIKEYGLPYPFFVRLDDVEFSKRIARPIISLNGISVWHEPFENKFNPAVYYYDIRNGLILNSVYYSDYGVLSAMKWFIKPAVKELYSYRYETAEKIIQAARDFLKGPQYITTLDPPENHRCVSATSEKPSKNGGQYFLYSKLEKSINQTETTLHFLFRHLTCNGHLLPASKVRVNKAIVVGDKRFKVVPFWGGRTLNAFGAHQVLYYNSQTGDGFIVHIDRVRFFQLSGELIGLCVLFLLKYSSTRKSYRSSFSRFTTVEFWKGYLGLSR